MTGFLFFHRRLIDKITRGINPVRVMYDSDDLLPDTGDLTNWHQLQAPEFIAGWEVLHQNPDSRDSDLPISHDTLIHLLTGDSLVTEDPNPS